MSPTRHVTAFLHRRFAAAARTRAIALPMLGVAALAVVGVACADAPSAPPMPAAPSFALMPLVSTVVEPTTVTALTRDVPLATSQTRSFSVSRSGGEFIWKEMGLRVTVPADAFKGKPLTITVTALAGDVVAYDFGPDGQRFDRPLEVRQDLRGTNFWRLGKDAQVVGAYFKSHLQVSDATNTAVIDAFEPTEVDLTNSHVRFQVTHFSGYMVSTGRKDRVTNDGL